MGPAGTRLQAKSVLPSAESQFQPTLLILDNFVWHPAWQIERKPSALLFHAMLDERSLLQLLERGAQLFLGVHHDRTVPGDGLPYRSAGDQ